MAEPLRPAAPSPWAAPPPPPPAPPRPPGPPRQPPHPGLVPPPPAEAVQRPRRVNAIPGTRFGVVTLDVPPTTSGLAIGALVAGIAAILVALVVVCFGLVGAGGGWGVLAAGAFALLAIVAGAGAVGLGVAGRRQIRQVHQLGPGSAMRFGGRGLATSGVVCGLVGLGVTLLGFVAALLLQLSV
jgi:hypothetical protein